jgi:hypothetical protein
MKKHNLKKQKGLSLLFVILITSVILGIGLGVSTIILQQAKMMGEIGYSINSFYAADSGTERQLYALYKETDTRQDNYSYTLNNSAFYNVNAKCSKTSGTSTCYEGFEKDQTCFATYYCINSVGTFEEINRAIEIEY